MFNKRHTILLFSITVLLSQFYFHLIPVSASFIDYMQDFAFVIGVSAYEFLHTQYQYYLYGLAPSLCALSLMKVFPPLKGFLCIQTLLSVLYAISIMFFIVKYIKTTPLFQALLALSLTCLLLNPGESIFGWKAPYTIGNSFGVVSTVFVFIFSTGPIKRKPYLNYLAMLLFGIVSVSSKIEYAAISIAYFVFLFFFRLMTDSSLRRDNYFILNLCSLFIIAAVAYVNWLKFLPPGMRIDDWCADPASNIIFFREAINTGTANKHFISNHAAEIIGTLDFSAYRILNILLQAGICILLFGLRRNTWIPERRIKIYTSALTIGYGLYLYSVALLDHTLLFRDNGLIALLLGACACRTLFRNRPLLLLAVFSLLFSFRTLFIFEFAFFSIFYMLPLLILFLSLIKTVYKLNAVFYMYIGLFLIPLSIKTSGWIINDSRYRLTVESVQGESFYVPNRMVPLLDTLSAIKKEYDFYSIGSSKNIPFLNIYFNLPNPVKKYVNVEFYPIGYRELYDSYLEEIKNKHPDVYVYIEPVMEEYLTAQRHQHQTKEEFIIKSNRFIRDLKKLYAHEYLVAPVFSTDGSYASQLRVFSGRTP